MDRTTERNLWLSAILLVLAAWLLCLTPGCNPPEAIEIDPALFVQEQVPDKGLLPPVEPQTQTPTRQKVLPGSTGGSCSSGTCPASTSAAEAAGTYRRGGLFRRR